MKPDWKDAPSWAKWVAMDKSGDWYWFEKQPRISPAEIWNGDGHAELAMKFESHWRETLEPRPVEVKP